MNRMIRQLFVGAALAAASIGAAPTASADPAADLFGMLPPGYSAGACHRVEGSLQDPGALAMVECSGNSLPNGPTDARYTLFSDVGALNNSFADIYRDTHHLKAVTCPGMTASPASWTGQSGTGGSIACGRFEGGIYTVMWTNDSGPLLALAFGGSDLNHLPGPDVNGLWQWWSRFVSQG